MRVPSAIPEIESESMFTDEPRLRFEPAVELEHLRSLLINYDPRDEPAVYYKPPRNTGVMIAKGLCYLFIGVFTLMIGLSILNAFTFGC